jgi:hypothetical protein
MRHDMGQESRLRDGAGCSPSAGFLAVDEAFERLREDRAAGLEYRAVIAADPGRATPARRATGWKLRPQEVFDLPNDPQRKYFSAT